MFVQNKFIDVLFDHQVVFSKVTDKYYHHVFPLSNPLQWRETGDNGRPSLNLGTLYVHSQLNNSDTTFFVLLNKAVALSTPLTLTTAAIRCGEELNLASHLLRHHMLPYLIPQSVCVAPLLVTVLPLLFREMRCGPQIQNVHYIEFRG